MSGLPASRAQQAAALPLHVESSGGGAGVLFWHGWGTNLRVFDALRGALGDTSRTTAVDLPGHGLSTWDERFDSPTADLQDQANLSRLLATLPPETGDAPGVTLVGWSLGGQLALRAALIAPRRIARLVLISTTPRFLRALDWPQGVDNELLRDMQARLAQDWRGTLSDFLELQVRGSRDAVATLHTLRAALLAHGAVQPRALAAGLTLLASTDLRARLAQIQIPTLVIAGQHDRVTRPAAGAALAAALPQARFVEFQRAAHAPFLSHPEQLATLLREFVDAGRMP